MSIGSPRVTVCVPERILAQVHRDMEIGVQHDSADCDALSEWIVAAIRERLAHRQRARSHRRPRLDRDQDGWPQIRVVLIADTDETGGVL